MFGLGFMEIIIIILGIIVFVRPKDLPKFVYRVGKIYGHLKESYAKFMREINLIRINLEDMAEKENQYKKEKLNTDSTTPDGPSEEFKRVTSQIQTAKSSSPTETVEATEPFKPPKIAKAKVPKKTSKTTKPKPSQSKTKPLTSKAKPKTATKKAPRQTKGK